MSATDELRRLLDEYGIEYYPKTADTTIWTASDGICHVRTDADLIDGRLELFVRPVTPQQAVDATLGKATCKRVKEHFEHSGGSYRLVCSECHHIIYDGWQEKPRYCPFCGRRVVNA